ncbi:adenylosuccinate lyase [Candidatus Peregrinibacteria bacterium]|nr:adenylosuccinate lyase [Candidatus Peregrinibacteria bacterium]
MIDRLFALSPLDGRYGEKLDALRSHFSEMALMRYRVVVEVEWLIFLCNQLQLKNTRPLKKNECEYLRNIYSEFNINDATRIKEIEKKTNHDVKAIEYFVREKIVKKKIKNIETFVHFACTSEDINNLSYALMLRDFLKNEYTPILEDLKNILFSMAKEYKKIPMLAHTHGQPASPTTVGKEFLNVVARLDRQLSQLNNIDFLAKMNGAVGNFNAHVIAYPEIDWIEASNEFIEQFELTPNLHTTQIEPHDFLAEIFDANRRINTILKDLSRDVWLYISMEYFRQKTKTCEIGSSTMPHKVNPIDFENAEGNFGIANALFTYFSEKLPISRLQRDLSDSTVLRNIGVAFGHSAIAVLSLIKGLKKIEINKEKMASDLENHWELLSEAIQTMARKYAITDAYEAMKTITRGKKNASEVKKNMQSYIETMKIPGEEKKKLRELTPETYIGLADTFTDRYDI